MKSSFDNSNDNKNIKNAHYITNLNHKNENDENSENLNIKNNIINEYNTINKFNTINNNNLFNETNILSKTLKVNRNNDILDTIENEDDKNNNLSNLIKDINFNNLNEYYEIQSSIFMKKIQKLNLKFYWTTEVFLNDKNIEYPYNKLFLILFKEISLYIDEIERLNKQLKLKTKNEKYYTQKIIQMDQKEKNNMINKQTIKNLQRNYNLLQKENNKYKMNIEKLNKKINYYSNTNKLNKNVLSNNINECKSLIGNQTIANTTLDSLNTPNSLILNNSSKTSKKISKKLMNKKNNNEIKEIIKNGIEECDEELKNLTKIEELLLAKKTKIFPRYYSRKKEKYKYINKTLK